MGDQDRETPKVPSYGFNPAFIRPLTFVPMKRVLGVPLAKMKTKMIYNMYSYRVVRLLSHGLLANAI
jgi:hypothetical protein